MSDGIVEAETLKISHVAAFKYPMANHYLYRHWAMESPSFSSTINVASYMANGFVLANMREVLVSQDKGADRILLIVYKLSIYSEQNGPRIPCPNILMSD
jgi:hypothetical protein